MTTTKEIRLIDCSIEQLIIQPPDIEEYKFQLAVMSGINSKYLGNNEIF